MKFCDSNQLSTEAVSVKNPKLVSLILKKFQQCLQRLLFNSAYLARTPPQSILSLQRVVIYPPNDYYSESLYLMILSLNLSRFRITQTSYQQSLLPLFFLFSYPILPLP